MKLKKSSKPKIEVITVYASSRYNAKYNALRDHCGINLINPPHPPCTVISVKLIHKKERHDYLDSKYEVKLKSVKKK